MRDPEENMSDGKKETVSITTFKIWLFANDFKETKDGKVLSALCKYCSLCKYFYLSSRCTVRYMSACTGAQRTIWGAWNVRCMIAYKDMLLGVKKKRDF